MEAHLVAESTAERTPRAKPQRWTRLRPKRRFLMPALALIAIVLVACGSSGSSGSGAPAGTGVPTATGGPSATSAPNASAPSGDTVSNSRSEDQAPDFTINLFQGQEAVGSDQVALSQLLGTQPIVLNFWAGLCPPCRAEMPDLQKFYEEFSDRVLLLGVDLGQFTGLGTQEDAQKLLQELGVTYPAGSTQDASVIPDYRVLGMPSTVFIDGNGEIFNNWTGALNEEVLREKTLEMLNQ